MPCRTRFPRRPRGLLLIILLGFWFPWHGQAQEVGRQLPAWTPGYLDIHHISTGKGSAAFFVLPDGTTMLFDAGAHSRPKPRIADPKPDGSRSPGEWIARYIRHMLAPVREPGIDFAIMSHFHEDHISGFVDVARAVPVRTVLDRGWPEYNWPAPLNADFQLVYRRFVEAETTQGRMRAERFRPGRNDQVTLLRQPDRYPSFEVRNIAANGVIWTGVSANTRNYIPPLETLEPLDRPEENHLSLVLRLSYGAFDYYTGGDLIGNPPPGSPVWHDLETPVAQVVGPVEVHVVNHHGAVNATNPYFLSMLQPQVHIIESWAPRHPSHSTLQRLLSTRIYPGPRDIFSTNTMEATWVYIGDNLARMKSQEGHIVVRVAPGGDQYHVIVLDDSRESYVVTAVHGPYHSR